MKHFVLVNGLLLSAQLFALNPVQGFYGGLMAEAAMGHLTIEYYSMKMVFSYWSSRLSPISGGGGVFLGYKYSHFRLEAEVLYNHISTGPVTVGPVPWKAVNHHPNRDDVHKQNTIISK